ncbi:hypothetical protein F2Q69_00027459 [Brassica cretica]|uniref:Uncharacterized protein n=1 Tax=Brassica cretica TaxID=69181 RepID=A0A8S9S0S5_BRACR|nr:hypothetical protein F2Q69_00027459 [Brassica cretica]
MGQRSRLLKGLTEVQEFGLDRSNGWPRERLDECDGEGGSAGDGLKDRYGSDSCWTYFSLKIRQGMNWIEGLHKEQWIGSLICQAAALNGFTQLKDLALGSRLLNGLTEVQEIGLDRTNGWPRERLDECDEGRIGRFKSANSWINSCLNPVRSCASSSWTALANPALITLEPDLVAEIQTTQGLTEVQEFGLDRSNGWPRERLDECDGGGGSAGLYLKQEEDRYGSDSRWTYVSLKIGREINWIEGLHKEQWIGSLICQAAALNGFTQLKDLGFKSANSWINSCLNPVRSCASSSWTALANPALITLEPDLVVGPLRMMGTSVVGTATLSRRNC